MKTTDYKSYSETEEKYILGKSGSHPQKVSEYVRDEIWESFPYFKDGSNDYDENRYLNVFDVIKEGEYNVEQNELLDKLYNKYVKTEEFKQISDPNEIYDSIVEFMENNFNLIATKYLIFLLKNGGIFS